MTFRFETHENVVMRARIGGRTFDDAANYGVNNLLGKDNVSLAEVTQDGDKLIIVKRIDKSPSLLYKWGFDQKHVFERTTID